MTNNNPQTQGISRRFGQLIGHVMMPIIRLGVLSPNRTRIREEGGARSYTRASALDELRFGRSRQDSRESPDGPVS